MQQGLQFGRLALALKELSLILATLLALATIFCYDIIIISDSYLEKFQDESVCVFLGTHFSNANTVRSIWSYNFGQLRYSQR